MAELASDQFLQFFFELHNRNPFPWQQALANRVCASGWPEVIDLPTASGKTACIDIALFALAVRGGEAPRRIFFVVNRRVVVNEAYLRMCEIQKKLKQSNSGILGAVAARLTDIASGDDPLHVYEMRGGAYRDETWVRNPLQPTVVASTVDQVGSRLLFRGYGVNPNTWPVHAGLIANDSLIILDEAHCSRAFAQTLQSVEQYRDQSWAVTPLRTPFRFVEMTATPSRTTSDPFRLTPQDRENESLRRRLQAPKPVRLAKIKGRKDDFEGLGDALILQALTLSKAAGAKRVAIFVNRVATAKIVYKQLRQQTTDVDVELVIGRMRAIDRDELYATKLKMFKSGESRENDVLTFVVSTQCLEVGADLDFDLVVSECASIDALQQRFGRLNRLGTFTGLSLGAIVIGSWQIEPKQPDPVYGQALSETWKWLESISGGASEVNMGIESSDEERPTVAQQLRSIDSTKLRLLGEDAPILLPAHIDAFVQTNPVPQPDPLVELFLHGPKSGAPDVQVLWRSDIDADHSENWNAIVNLCPPSSRETMPVQIYTFKKWFSNVKSPDENESDLEMGLNEQEPKQNKFIRQALVWEAKNQGYLIHRADQVKPGQTLVLPASKKGWDELGHIPKGAPNDVGDQAAFGARKSISLRFHPDVMKEWPQTPALTALKAYATQEDAVDNVEELLKGYLVELDNAKKPWPHSFISHLGKLTGRELNTYPDRDDALVFQARHRSAQSTSTGEVLLDAHLSDVKREVSKLASKLAANFVNAFETAAHFHDYGKIDLRFQVWLRGGDRLAAQYAPEPIAKSAKYGLGRQAFAGLPENFRHELLSLMFAEKSSDLELENRDLILHLIASHHGRCRPFAPVVIDPKAECVTYNGISVCAKERVEQAPFRLDRGVADRFWRLTRNYGWWGLPYLESIIRLADWRASGNEFAPEVSQ